MCVYGSLRKHRQQTSGFTKSLVEKIRFISLLQPLLHSVHWFCYVSFFRPLIPHCVNIVALKQRPSCTASCAPASTATSFATSARSQHSHVCSEKYMMLISLGIDLCNRSSSKPKGLTLYSREATKQN